MIRRSIGRRTPEPAPKLPAPPPSARPRLSRRWKRILIGVLALPALVALYTAVRAVQYWSSELTALDRLPADPDVVIYAPGLAAAVERWRTTGAWESIQKRILRDPAARRRINEDLTAAGFPSLDQLDDERFLSSREGRLFRLENLLELIGRDAAAAMRAGSDGRWHVLVAVRLPFTYFWAAPLAEIFPSLAGARREGDGLRLGGAWIAFDSTLALAGDDAGMVAEALSPGRRARVARPSGGAPVLVEFRPSSEAAARAAEAITDAFPLGVLAHFADLRSASAARLELDLAGAAVTGRVRIDGAPAAEAGPEAAALLERIPEQTFFVQPTASRGKVLWDWLRRAVTGPATGGGSVQWAGSDLAETVRLAAENGFEQQVLPLLDGPSLVAFGNEETFYPKARGSRMLVGAVLFHCSNAAAAESALEGIVQTILRTTFKAQAALRKEERGDAVLHIVQAGPDDSGRHQPYEPLYFVQPCFGRVGPALVIATNPAYLRAIADTGRTVRKFVEGDLWRQYARELEPAGLAGLLEDPSVSAGVLHLDHFRQAALVYVAPLAEFQEVTDANMRRIRLEIEQDYRANRIVKTPDEVGSDVMDEVQRRVNRTAEKVRGQIEVLQWFGTLGLKAEPTAAGLDVRWAATLYRTPP
jgi:hypothetical protein